MTKPSPRLSLGIDVGGTHLRAALMDTTGAIVRSVRRNLAERDPDSIINHIAEVRDELGVDAGQHLPIGLGLAASILIETGTVAVAPNLGWFDVPFGDMLTRRFGDHVRMVNDLNAIAVGESVRGAGEGTRDVVCVFVGTGVGMGAVVNGHVIEGADGLAAELGHIKVASVKTGRQCGCGERGCLEAYTSGRHLPELLQAKVAEGFKSPLAEAAKGDAKKLTAGAIDAAAEQGDAAAQALWLDVCDHLARAIGAVVTLFNPRVLVLGGGVLQSAPNLHRALSSQISDFAAQPALRALRICGTKLADDAGVIGAGLLALEEQAALAPTAPNVSRRQKRRK